MKRSDLDKCGRLGLFFIAALIVGGCAAKKPPPTGSSIIEHFQPEQEGTRVSSAPLIIPPGALEQALPEYPEDALAAGVACVARILYHVERTGEARLVKLEWDVPPPDGHAVAFEQAIRAAMSGWSFVPAVRIAGKLQEDGSIELERTPIPQAQHAFIRFRVEDGEAIVE